MLKTYKLELHAWPDIDIPWMCKNMYWCGHLHSPLLRWVAKTPEEVFDKASDDVLNNYWWTFSPDGRIDNEREADRLRKHFLSST